MSQDSSPEPPKLHLGIPPYASVEIPLRLSGPTWFRRIFQRLPAASLIRVPSARARVHIPGEDSGTVELWVTIVNMTNRPLVLQNFLLHRLTASGPSLPVNSPPFEPPPNPTPPLSISEAYIRIPLSKAAVRQLMLSVSSAQNTYSSPRAELVLVGVFIGSLGRLTVQIPITVAAPNPELQLTRPNTRGH